MDIIDRIRKFFGRSDELITLPEGFDTRIFSAVFVNAKTPEQREKVIRSLSSLVQLWKDGDSAHFPQIMAEIEETYPHLEKMDDLEAYSAEWIAECAALMKATTDNYSNHIQQEEETNKLLQEFLGKDK